jgi:peptide subunit release factor 1 (eRF1)
METIQELEVYKAHTTCLISLIISHGEDFGTYTTKLKNEHRTASNIKDKNNRKQVLDALRSIDVYMKNYKNSPTGTAIFVGQCI